MCRGSRLPTSEQNPRFRMATALCRELGKLVGKLGGPQAASCANTLLAFEVHLAGNRRPQVYYSLLAVACGQPRYQVLLQCEANREVAVPLRRASYVAIEVLFKRGLFIDSARYAASPEAETMPLRSRVGGLMFEYGEDLAQRIAESRPTHVTIRKLECKMLTLDRLRVVKVADGDELGGIRVEPIAVPRGKAKAKATPKSRSQ